MVTIYPRAVALTIAGSDPSGGAGLQADLKTFQQLGVYGMSVVTLITVQNTQVVRRVEVLSAGLVLDQLEAVLTDIPPGVIKTGALGNAEMVRSVSERLQNVECPIVVDPVLVSKHGHLLADDDVVEAYKKFLLPQAWLVTPNRFEAERLTGVSLEGPEQISEAIHRLEHLGARHVLIKLGAVEGQAQHMLSLATHNAELVVPRLPEGNTHGAGCVLSAAIAAKVALGETDVKQAVLFGIQRTLDAIHCNTQLGHGIHPVETRVMQN
jgi:hydroxymethylpyrimidine/phosphomethylpyrimidine kinase